MSSINQSVQYIIDANAPMVFTYAHSRPEFQRIVHPIGIVGDVVHTLDAETGKFKKFKLDGIIFPNYAASAEYLSYAIEQGFTVSFYYRNSNPEFKRVGVPVKLSKDNKSVLVRLETYLPYRRYSNQTPTYVEHKYFKINAMENLQSEHYYLPEKVQVEREFPEWMVSSCPVERDWFPVEETNIDDEEPLEVDLIELEELPVKFSTEEESDDENDPDYEPSDDECETTDEMPSSDDDEKSCSDEEVVYEDEGVRITKKMLEEEAAKIKKNTARNKELKQVVDAIECIGCRHGLANQQAHYGGCIDYEEY
jgi:hypothetical protein